MTTARVRAEPLLFPCLVAIGNELLRAPKKDLVGVWIKAHLGGNRFLLRRGATDRLPVRFIIDRNGLFRQVHCQRLRRRWARWLAWLYDFVLSECELMPGERLTNSELLERIGGLPKDPIFRQAEHLRVFLLGQPPAEPFDGDRFRQFWNQRGPTLRPQDWAEQFPEDQLDKA